MTDQSDVPTSTPEELEAARLAGQAIFKQFVDAQVAKHGEDWQDKFSAELTERMAPVMQAFLKKPKEPVVPPQESNEG